MYKRQQESQLGSPCPLIVKLLSQPQPSTLVVLTVATNDSTELSLNQSQISFADANWNQPQTILIYPLNGYLAEGDIVGNVSLAAHTTLSSAPAYTTGNVATKSILVTNVDNNTAEIDIVSPVSSCTVHESQLGSCCL